MTTLFVIADWTTVDGCGWFQLKLPLDDVIFLTGCFCICSESINWFFKKLFCGCWFLFAFSFCWSVTDWLLLLPVVRCVLRWNEKFVTLFWGLTLPCWSEWFGVSCLMKFCFVVLCRVTRLRTSVSFIESFIGLYQIIGKQKERMCFIQNENFFDSLIKLRCWVLPLLGVLRALPQPQTVAYTQ